MHTWRGIATHLILALGIPFYLGVRWSLNQHYFRHTSLGCFALAGISWGWVVTQITIPFFTTPLRHLPGPAGDRLFWGHMRLWREDPPTKSFLKLVEETPNDGLIIFWGFLYIRPHVIPTTPDALLDILNTHSYDWEKPTAAKKILSRVLGEGLVNVEGNTHKGMRKAVAPAFSGRHIRDLVPLFWTKGVAFADSMTRTTKSSPDGTVEMMTQMSRVTLDIIGAAGVGKDFNTIENNEDRLAQLYESITNTDRGPPLLFFLVNVFIPQWLVRKMYGTVWARIAIATAELRQSIRDLLAEKKLGMDMKTAQQKDIIATIMRSGDFPDDYLVSQLLTFLAAGHDTTASALTWTSWLLSINPEVQDRLRTECQQYLSDKPTESVDADVFDRMPYLTACCNETLRLYPTVPVTARHAVVATRVGDYAIPKGAHAFISPWSINRLPSLWGANADKYMPERWIDGPLAATGGAKSPHALTTFLHGPRSCIGQSFARTEMRCILAALILRFRFELADPEAKVVPAGFVTIKPKGGLKLKLHELSSVSEN